MEPSKQHNAMVLAELIDAFRIVPRSILIGYAYLTWEVVSWYMGLPSPSTQHAVLVTAIVGIIAPITAFYQTSGRKWNNPKE